MSEHTERCAATTPAARALNTFRANISRLDHYFAEAEKQAAHTKHVEDAIYKFVQTVTTEHDDGALWCALCDDVNRSPYEHAADCPLLQLLEALR